MATLIYYNPSEHDIFKYNSGPTIDPANYLNNQQVYGVCYNNNLYIKNPIYGFPVIDFTGISLRPRGAPGYGFDQYINSGGNSAGVIDNSGTITYPNIVQGYFNGYLPSRNDYEGRYACYYPGCPTGDFKISSNYNYWNNGQWAAILISPKHFLVTSHFIGYGATTTNVSFLGSNNTVYTKSATKKFYFSYYAPYGPAGYTFPPGYTWSYPPGPESGVFKDWSLFELDGDGFTGDELNHVKIYKFMNSYSIPIDVPQFAVHPQGNVTVRKKTRNFDYRFYFNPDINKSVPYTGYFIGEDPIASESFVFPGDSGTPILIYDPVVGETCFQELRFGGGGFYYDFTNIFTPQNDKVMFDALKEYIFDRCGYEISIVNYSETPQPPPESINIDGSSYYIAAYLPASSGIGSYTLEGLNTGTTYSFALIAYNGAGYSGYAKIDNVYIPVPSSE